jgi:IclR family transcriptional regulator, acetate operon repressor
MLQSVATALTVFETVAVHQPIGVSDLARTLRVCKSTVQRCLVTLQQSGWLRPESAESSRWVITAKSFTLGRNAGDTQDLVSSARPIMETLREQTRESIHLVIADGSNAVLLERLESPRAVRVFVRLGESGPLHLSATGKVILAFSRPEVREGYLSRDLARMTPYSITDPSELRRELARIRARGYAISTNEHAEGASAIAAAVLNCPTPVAAAISISGPTVRFPKLVRQRYAKLVVNAAARILNQHSPIIAPAVTPAGDAGGV